MICISVYIGKPRHDEILLDRTWISEQKKSWMEGRGLSILMVGRVSTGKSTLINLLLGRKKETKMRLGGKKTSIQV